MTAFNQKKIWTKYCDLWHNLSGWRLFLFYSLHYTLLFIILQYFVFAAFYKADKSFIWSVDGTGNWIPKLMYISQTLRDGIQDLLAGDGWTIPLYDFRVGPVKLDFQVGLLYWLAVLWPWDQVDVLNDILVIFRFYLLGLSFSAMGFYFKQKPIAILIGAVTYTFSADFLYTGITHSPFLIPAIFLPLLIIGLEHILRGKQGFIFTAIVFLSLIGSLYHSYMLAILIVVYFLVRYFCSYNKSIKHFFQTVARALLWGGLGAALSGIVVIPTLLQMLGTGRIGRETGQLWCYSKSYYENFISSFAMAPGDILNWTYLGFSALAVPAVALLFFRAKQYPERKPLRVLFISLTVMMCIPAAAYIFSGLNDTSNRWCYAYALCVAAIVMFELPKLENTNRRYLIFAGAASLVYILVCYFFIQKKFYHEESVVFLLITFLLFVCCYFVSRRGRKSILTICLVLTCVSASYSAFWRYDPSAGNYVKEFVSQDKVYSTYEAGQYASLGESGVVEKDGSFFRVSASNLSINDAAASFYWDLKGLSFYTSNINNSYKKMHSELEILHKKMNIWQCGIDGRAPILSLFNVKYTAVRENAPIPYGFEEVDNVNKDIILENRYFLPVGYTYDAYMDQAAFEQLSPIEKQEAMLQALVLEDKSDTVRLCENPDLLSQKMPVKVTAADGLSWKDGKLKVNKENASMTLSFDGLAGADTYLRTINLDLTSGSSKRNWLLTAETEETSTNARFTADGWLYSHGAKNQVLYLGNSPEGYTTCTLTFPQKGMFILDDLEIWCQPMDNYTSHIETLRAEPLENIETNWRGLTGTVDLSKNKMMCFGIPYETGWSVYVDGEKQELVQANIGLMAVELEAGTHEIELKYWTPGLTIGIVLSCLGLVLLGSVILYHEKHTKNGRPQEDRMR